MIDAPTITADMNWKPRFYAIWSGQALSLIGSVLTNFVLVWWITQETGSASALATAGIAALLPVAIFSPLGGALADRFSRRAIMIVTDAITAGCMVVLVLLFATERIELWQVYTLMFVRATMQAFQQPAAAASTVNLVPPDFVPRAAGMNQTMQGVLTIAGAPLGALAMSALPIQGALSIDIITALIGITPLLFFRVPQPSRPEYMEAQSLWHSMVEGARYVFRDRGLRELYFVLGLVVFTVMPTFTLTPLLVTQHFGGGINQVALMEGLAGVGVILGGIAITVWPPATGRRIVVTLLSFSASCATVALTALSGSQMLWLAIVWWFISGVTFSTGNAPMTAIMQTSIPNQMQGRAFSLLNVVFGLAGPLGLLIAGPMGERFGVRTVFIVGGTLSAIICAGGLSSPALRNIEDGASAQAARAIETAPTPEYLEG
jgi:DHA3 family macrolide efflux protein-like MFS transporter